MEPDFYTLKVVMVGVTVLVTGLGLASLFLYYKYKSTEWQRNRLENLSGRLTIVNDHLYKIVNPSGVAVTDGELKRMQVSMERWYKVAGECKWNKDRTCMREDITRGKCAIYSCRGQEIEDERS